MVKNRIAYIDYLRIAATLAVIVIHVAAQNWYDQDVQTLEWQIFNFYDSSVRWAVPIFVMISGVLTLEKEISVKALYTRKILRLIVAYIFWSCIYALTGDEKKGFVYQLICGKYHLWFIYMILGVYICTPLIKKIVESQKLMVYFLIVSIIYSFFVPYMLQLLSDWGGIKTELWVKSFNNIYADMNVSFVCGYTAYFIGGYFLSRVTIKKHIRGLIYLLGILGFVMTVIPCSVFSVRNGSPVAEYYEYLKINVLMQSVAVFVWFKYNVAEMGKKEELIGKLATYSFGVYLVHILILEQLDKKIGLNTLSFNPIAAIPAITLLVCAVSYGVSALIHRIPVLNKYIV